MRADRFVAGYTFVALDVHSVTRLIKDLGIDEKVVLKSINGKNRSFLRTMLETVQYSTLRATLPNNQKVVDMAISKVEGKQGNSIQGRLNVFLVILMNVLSYMMSDRQTME